MAKATKDPNQDLHDKISKKLRKLEKLSPREIREKIGLFRRGLNQNDGLLGNWLKEQLGLEKLFVKGIQNLDNNCEVTVFQGTTKLVLNFHVGTSVQDFLGIRKDSAHAVSGISLSQDQATLIRAFVDSEGGDEREIAKQALIIGLVNMPAIRNYVKRVRKHPEWHKGMHEAGLYPSDIFHAWKNILKEAKRIKKGK